MKQMDEVYSRGVNALPVLRLDVDGVADMTLSDGTLCLARPRRPIAIDLTRSGRRTLPVLTTTLDTELKCMHLTFLHHLHEIGKGYEIGA